MLTTSTALSLESQCCGFRNECSKIFIHIHSFRIHSMWRIVVSIQSLYVWRFFLISAFFRNFPPFFFLVPHPRAINAYILNYILFFFHWPKCLCIFFSNRYKLVWFICTVLVCLLIGIFSLPLSFIFGFQFFFQPFLA